MVVPRSKTRQRFGRHEQRTDKSLGGFRYIRRASRRTASAFGLSCFLLALTLVSLHALHAEPLRLAPASDLAGFPLVAQGSAAPLVGEPGLDPAVARAAADLAADVARVSGLAPVTLTALPSATDPSACNFQPSALPTRAVVLFGIVDQSPLLDRLAAAGKLDLQPLRGAWESFVIQTVAQPFSGVDRALVIAGSDRRGAIYGLYELSAAIGVSPWHWWADVPAPHRDTLVLAAGTHRFGPPSVKYRGLFLNDEDWGLQPWAAKTFDPETGDIGPKTYAKVFELLLRLKANTLWPAMHACTKPFNANPANARLAAAYGLVMGSSHAEPMLRNNVGEWTDPPEKFNYLANRDGVLRYWERRVAANAAYESIYTLGLRGIHDSNMVGPTTDAERVATLERIFADQRALLVQHVRPEAGRVPQIFCAYKEVLDLYRQGLRVPDDVTLVWPDDNFGYIRSFATPAERTRAGGFGVYYHLSYLGRPLAYLWLCTTPPALIWEEMRKAYDHGADRLWIANVGDLKPAEIATTFFLELAWDADRWRADNLAEFLPVWATRTFGPENAAEIAAVLDDYYRLNFPRKPEHLQWWLPRQPYRPSPLTDAEVQQRLAASAALHRRAETLRARIPATQQDAFYELVFYPVVGAALANERYFEGERGRIDLACAADARLAAETRFFNDELAGGKWHGFMNLEPADSQWASMRLAPWTPPPSAHAAVPAPAAGTGITVDAAAFATSTPDNTGAVWTAIPGLGRSGHAVTVQPFTAVHRELADSAAAPRLDYAFTFPAAGTFVLRLHLLPTHPLGGAALRLAVALDAQPPQLVALGIDDGGPDWSQGVLEAERIVATSLTVAAPGPRLLHVWGLAPGVVVDRLTLDFGKPSASTP